jgi:hypothetical protein
VQQGVCIIFCFALETGKMQSDIDQISGQEPVKPENTPQRERVIIKA